MPDIFLYIIYIFLFLLPVFTLPFTDPAGDTDKQVLLVLFSFVLFLFALWKIIRVKKCEIIKTAYTIPLFLISCLAVLSAIFQSPNKTDAFFLPFSAATFVACFLLYISMVQITSTFKKPISFAPLYLGTLLSSLYILVIMLVPKGAIPSFLMRFSPYPNLLSAVTFPALVISLMGTEIYKLFKPHPAKISNFPIKKLSIIIPAFLLSSGAILVSLYHLLTDQKPLLLPFTSAWPLMLEAYKNLQVFFLGVGPANYSYAYSLGKPLTVNATQFWNLIASSAGQFPLTMATELGIIAGIIFFYICYQILRSFSVPLIVCALLLIFLPANLPIFILFVILLALSAPKQILTTVHLSPKAVFMPAVYTAVITTLIILGAAVWFGKNYAAELFYRNAFSGKTYDQSRASVDRAISINPDTDRYYSLSSQISLQIAQTLSQNQKSSESAALATSYASRAVSDAKTATSLNPTNSQNWGRLAAIYQMLIGTADKADQFALDAYLKQFSLDPASPQPKVQAGGLLLNAGQFTSAAQLFSQAVNLKPDWNNAHYNLALTLVQLKQFDQAQKELETTLVLTPKDTVDYKNVEKNLNDLKDLIAKSSSPSATPTP
jgi:tetratricopeptide (TPR) repeat protein